MPDDLTFYLTATDAEGLPVSLAGTIRPCGPHLRVCLDGERPQTRTLILPGTINAGDLYARICEHLRPAVPAIA